MSSNDQGTPFRRSGILLCLVGPAGSGKTTFCRRLEESEGERVAISVSMTSRAKRAGEKEGRSYYFLTRKQFEKEVASGNLFEWEEVHGNFYGTPQAAIDRALSGDVDMLFDVDIRGALNLKGKLPDHTVVVFIVPPDFATLKERLLGRGPIEEEDLRRRFETARKEYELFLGEGRSHIDYFLINDDAEETFGRLGAILHSERLRVSRINSNDLERLCSIPKGVKT